MLNKQLPQDVKDDIKIYLSPEETIISAINAINGSGKTSGKVWLILTNKSIFFHTKEPNKESVVALLARSNIKIIEYFQKKTEIVLTFIPLSNPKNTTVISFPVKRKEVLENFCEDLADLIEFKKETKSGIKTYPRSEPISSDKPDKTDTKNYESKVKLSSNKHINEVKLAKPSKQPNTGLQSDTSLQSDNIPSAKYVLFATLSSIVVAFIWYQFFKFISHSKR